MMPALRSIIYFIFVFIFYKFLKFLYFRYVLNPIKFMHLLFIIFLGLFFYFFLFYYLEYILTFYNSFNSFYFVKDSLSQSFSLNYEYLKNSKDLSFSYFFVNKQDLLFNKDDFLLKNVFLFDEKFYVNLKKK